MKCITFYLHTILVLSLYEMVSREFWLTFRILRTQIVDIYLRTSGSSKNEISIIRNTLYTNGIDNVHTISKIFTRLQLSRKNKDVLYCSISDTHHV